MLLKSTLCSLLLTLLLALPALAQTVPDDPRPDHPPQDGARAMALVEKAADYVHRHGAEAAVTAFHDPSGGFVDGELYILFYTFDGTCLANGAKPRLAGKNRFDVHDPDGVHQIREMIELARKDGGWVYYKYDNPVTGTMEPKATFVRRAPGMDAFVGCGVYAQ